MKKKGLTAVLLGSSLASMGALSAQTSEHVTDERNVAIHVNAAARGEKNGTWADMEKQGELPQVKRYSPLQEHLGEASVDFKADKELLSRSVQELNKTYGISNDGKNASLPDSSLSRNADGYYEMDKKATAALLSYRFNYKKVTGHEIAPDIWDSFVDTLVKNPRKLEAMLQTKAMQKLIQPKVTLKKAPEKKLGLFGRMMKKFRGNANG